MSRNLDLGGQPAEPEDDTPRERVPGPLEQKVIRGLTRPAWTEPALKEMIRVLAQHADEQDRKIEALERRADTLSCMVEAMRQREQRRHPITTSAVSQTPDPRMTREHARRVAEELIRSTQRRG